MRSAEEKLTQLEGNEEEANLGDSEGYDGAAEEEPGTSCRRKIRAQNVLDLKDNATGFFKGKFFIDQFSLCPPLLYCHHFKWCLFTC
jgi:hypothetical protein